MKAEVITEIRERANRKDRIVTIGRSEFDLTVCTRKDLLYICRMVRSGSGGKAEDRILALAALRKRFGEEPPFWAGNI